MTLLEVNIKRKQFKKNKVIEGLKFTLEPRQFTTIIGPTGCGKSTLLKLIAGLDNDYIGIITLDNNPIRGHIQECGIVFQEPRLLPWMTVKDNICFGLENNKNKATSKNETINKLLKILSLEHFSKNFPYQLSGGMAQRTALARALVNLPELLLLDEPFNSVDVITRYNLQKLLLKTLQQEKATALMVTHDIEEAVYLSDKILVMKSSPSTIIKSYDVNLPRPRNRTDSEFLKIKSQLYLDLKKELKIN